MSTITYDQFSSLDIRIAKIIAVEEIDGADKLYKITLDVGLLDEDMGGYVGLGERVIAAGIKPWYTSEELVGKHVPYLANLEPRELKGVVSQGMLLAAGSETAVLLNPEKEVLSGTKVR